MSDRTFRLILDGKKGGLVKGSSPSSAAKKACKKLSAEQMKNSSVFHQLSLKDKVLKTEPGKTSFKFELQETTKGSKKKVYGPYKTKVKMAGGGHENNKPDKQKYTQNELSELPSQIVRQYVVNNGHSRFQTSAPNTHYGLPTAAAVLGQMNTNKSKYESEKRNKNKKRYLERRFGREAKFDMQNDPHIPIAPKSTKGLTYHNTNISLIYPNGKTERIKKSQLTHIRNNQYAYKNLDIYNQGNIYRVVLRQSNPNIEVVY